MEAAKRCDAASGSVIRCTLASEKFKTSASVISVVPKPETEDISQADILVVGGRGLKKKEDAMKGM